MTTQTKRLIYSLSCPFTNSVHYIGKSTVGMTRPMQHLKKSHSIKIQEWVEDLKKLGYKPIVLVVEYLTESDDIDKRERFWIQKELDNGSLLLNIHLITPVLISPTLDELLSDGEGKELMILAEFVKQRRKKAGLTQMEFAEKAGIALTVIRKIEQGDNKLNLVGVIHVLNMFGHTIGVTPMIKESSPTAKPDCI